MKKAMAAALFSLSRTAAQLRIDVKLVIGESPKELYLLVLNIHDFSMVPISVAHTP